MPHHREGQGLRFHGVRQALSIRRRDGLKLQAIVKPREKAMSIMLKSALRALFVTVALGIVSNATAQTAPAPARSSVLATGGGQALLDTSDTVLLLLDHQAGLFQTVKDVPLVDLRAN